MNDALNPKPVIDGFGPVRQLGHVVEDIDTEIDRWKREENLGPWMVMRNVHLPCTYRGEKSRPVIHVALAYRGDMQIEFIQQINEDPSPYLEVIKSGNYGLHHTAHLCDNIHKDTDRAVEQGLEVVCDIRMMGARYVYLQSPDGGPYVEFLPASLMMRSMFKQGIAAARRWDGKAQNMTINLQNVFTILGSMPSAAGAWLSQR